MNREQLMTVLVAPHVTEKTSMAMQNHNQYVFRVRRQATKIEIKQAIEALFNVKVADVHTQIVRGKDKRVGRFEGQRSTWKKAIVTLHKGQKIDFFEGV